jgi:hypothetical protein
MPKLSDLKLSKLGSNKYKDVKFRLQYIADISTKPGENYYNAIFESIKAIADFDIQEKIYPELLNYHVVGTIYQHGKRIDKNKNLGPLQIKFPLLDGKILKVKEINKITGRNINKDNQKYAYLVENQYAYLSRFDEYFVIIPCHVIGTSFYFTSTTMPERIFDSKIQSLYHETGIDKEKGYPYVLLKTGVPDSDNNFFGIYKIKEIIEKKDEKAKNDNNNVNVVSGKEAKDISFNPLRDGKNSNLRAGETKKTESDYFTSYDFKELIEMFLNQYSEFVETESVVISNPAKFPAAENKKHFNRKESYDGKNFNGLYYGKV